VTIAGRNNLEMNRSGRITVLLIAKRDPKALIGQKNNDRIAVTIWQVLDRLGSAACQGNSILRAYFGDLFSDSRGHPFWRRVKIGCRSINENRATFLIAA
jgi:hypothetical protein